MRNNPGLGIMPQVMVAQPRKACLGAQAVPGVSNVDIPCPCFQVGEHVLILSLRPDLIQDFNGGIR